MKAINITKQDLVKNMSDEQKHRLTLSCQLHDISIEETLDLMERIANKSINDALKVHDQVFIELGLLYHDPVEAGDEFEIYAPDGDIYLDLDFGEDYEGYYGKYAFLRGGYGVFINKDYTADYGYFTSEAYGHGMGSYEYYNFNDIEDWDEVKIALTKVIDEIDIWE